MLRDGQMVSGVVAVLSEKPQGPTGARLNESSDEIENLGELRRVVGKGQAEIASTLNIKQPSVSKIENQADMYLSTLRSYVEAVGGELDLIVRLPSRRPLRIRHLGDITAQTIATKSRVPKEV